MTAVQFLHITSILFLLIISICIYAWLTFSIVRDFIKTKSFELFILLSILIAAGVLVATGIILDFKI